MASARKVALPSYEDTMDRLRRNDAKEKANDQYLERGVYRKRTEDDVLREEERLKIHSSDRPATISHTTITPTFLHQTESVFLPSSPTVESPTAQGSTGLYTKRSQKSASRMSSKRDCDRDDNQQSADYWSSNGSSSSVEGVAITDEPILMRPMVTRVGADGRTYLRDTSIVVVEQDEHETPNTMVVYGTRSMPNDYRWYAILGLVICFFIGLISFRKSRQVRKRFDHGEFDKAQKASTSALMWGNVALITGALIIIIVIFLFFVDPCPLARVYKAVNICPGL